MLETTAQKVDFPYRRHYAIRNLETISRIDRESTQPLGGRNQSLQKVERQNMGLAMYYMYWWKSLKAACNWFAPICAQIGCLDGFVSVISETPAPRLTSMNHRQ